MNEQIVKTLCRLQKLITEEKKNKRKGIKKRGRERDRKKEKREWTIDETEKGKKKEKRIFF